MFSTTAPWASLPNPWATIKKIQQKLTSVSEAVKGGERALGPGWWTCQNVKGTAAAEDSKEVPQTLQNRIEP